MLVRWCLDIESAPRFRICLRPEIHGLKFTMWPGDTIWRHQWFSNHFLPEPNLTYLQSQIQEHISVKFYLRLTHSYFKKNALMLSAKCRPFSSSPNMLSFFVYIMYLKFTVLLRYTNLPRGRSLCLVKRRYVFLIVHFWHTSIHGQYLFVAHLVYNGGIKRRGS